MLRSIKELHGYQILATDGQVGKVKEFYFDDNIWTIVYLVVDTGSWLREKMVLISPVALKQPEWSSHLFPVGLSRKEIEGSPDIDVDKPVSRRHEIKLNQYYNWPLYWTGIGLTYTGRTSAVPPPFDVEQEEMAGEEAWEQEEDVDTSLRSTGEVIGYGIRASDGDIGHVEDFIVEDETWIIRYMVVDTRNWLPGKKVLVAPTWIQRFDWAGAQVHVELSRDDIKDSPEYDPSNPVNREYEERLYDFYGRPKYWL